MAQPSPGDVGHTCTCSAGASVERCRTEALGGQVFGCVACQEFQYSYHSCRNRHYPKCQHEQTQAWLEVQRELLLPVPYFMLTFTLPSELRELASRNQKRMYALLFQAAAQAAQKLAKDPRYVGGQIGLVGVLHTWTRNLIYHPHVHYLAPGGGLSPDGHTWLPTRNQFFLPVKALSNTALQIPDNSNCARSPWKALCTAFSSMCFRMGS